MFVLRQTSKVDNLNWRETRIGESVVLGCTCIFVFGKGSFYGSQSYSNVGKSHFDGDKITSQSLSISSHDMILTYPLLDFKITFINMWDREIIIKLKNEFPETHPEHQVCRARE